MKLCYYVPVNIYRVFVQLICALRDKAS